MHPVLPSDYIKPKEPLPQSQAIGCKASVVKNAGEQLLGYRVQYDAFFLLFAFLTMLCFVSTSFCSSSSASLLMPLTRVLSSSTIVSVTGTPSSVLTSVTSSLTSTLATSRSEKALRSAATKLVRNSVIGGLGQARVLAFAKFVVTHSNLPDQRITHKADTIGDLWAYTLKCKQFLMCFPVSFSSLVCPLASRLSCTNTLLCTRNLTLSTFVRRLALPMTMEWESHSSLCCRIGQSAGHNEANKSFPSILLQDADSSKFGSFATEVCIGSRPFGI
ncbi:DNA glycosylase, partial [Aureobasidium melanogenum]